VLEDPPRDSQAPLFSRSDYKRMTLEGALISASALGAYGYGILRYGMGARAGSLAFHGLTIGQLMHALSCRSEKHTLLDRQKPPPNHYLNAALGGSLLMQLLTMFVPGLRGFLGLTALTVSDLAVVAGTALLPLTLNEAIKWTSKENPDEE